MNASRMQIVLMICFVLLLFLAAAPAHAGIAAAGVAEPSHSARVITTDVLTVNISNEPPGYLIDQLYDRLGDVSFAVALEYLKDHSNGIITEEFYNQVIEAPGSEEVFLTRLIHYRKPFVDSISNIAVSPLPGRHTITLSSCPLSRDERPSLQELTPVMQVPVLSVFCQLQGVS